MAATNPLISVIIPVGNVAEYLPGCLHSVLECSWRPLEAAIHIDVDTDGCEQIIQQWTPTATARGIQVTVTRTKGTPGGPGWARAVAIAACSGSHLCLLDGDDVMHSNRVQAQYDAWLRCTQHGSADSPAHALIGCGFHRTPAGSTARYTEWANSLTNEQLVLEQYRECTLLQPTWFMSKDTFYAAGGYVWTPDMLQQANQAYHDAPLQYSRVVRDALQRSVSTVPLGEPRAVPDAEQAASADQLCEFWQSCSHDPSAPAESQAGEKRPRAAESALGPAVYKPIPEDLVLFLHALHRGVRLHRVPDDLLTYTYRPSSLSWQIKRVAMMRVRAAALSARVLQREPWTGGFYIWGAGRDGKTLFKSIAQKSAVKGFLDIDPAKCGSKYTHPDLPKAGIPILHFEDAPPAPIVTAVAYTRDGQFAVNLGKAMKRMGLVDGETVWKWA